MIMNHYFSLLQKIVIQSRWPIHIGTRKCNMQTYNAAKVKNPEFIAISLKKQRYCYII